MLNLKAAKELAARELDSQASDAKIAAATPMSARGSRFGVGDRVEYLSETYQQWMAGTVTRVREGGQTYDLDVKKGAHVSKLRPLALGSARGRSPAPLASDTLLQAPSAASSGGAGSAAAPGSRPSSRPGSARGGARDPLLPSKAPSAMAAKEGPVALRRPRPPAGPAGRAEVSLPQARQLQSEITQVTEAIQGQAADWAELSGQDMVSRAGSVTVRKMVETTKALLQGLEGALILRAGFIASCFHMWRCEATLQRAGRLYQDEFERHHEEWTQHLEHTRASFEEQLGVAEERELARKEAARQRAMYLVDKSFNGGKAARKRETFLAWRSHTAKEKKAKASGSSLQIVIDQWAGGKVKGIGRIALQAWHKEAVKEKAEREKQTSADRLRQEHQDQLDAVQRQVEEKMRSALEEIEQKRHDGRKNVDVVLAKWMKGNAKGVLLSCVTNWAEWARKQAEGDRRTGAVEMQIKRFLEGNARGSKHQCFLRWKAEYQESSRARRQEDLTREREQLNKTLAEQQKLLEAAEREKVRAEEQRKKDSDSVVQMILMKWEMGGAKGTLKSTIQAWSKAASESKKKGRAMQAINDSLMRALAGDKKAAIMTGFRNWKALTLSEKTERSAQMALAKQQEEWAKQQAQMQAEHERQKAELERQAANLAARAHQATRSMLEQWFAGERKGLLKATWQSWQELMAKTKDAEKRRNAVSLTLMRMVQGERKGTMNAAFSGWKKTVQTEKEHAQIRGAQASELEMVQEQLKKVLSHAESRIGKYAAMMAGQSSGALLSMTLSGWRVAIRGEIEEAESQREQEVAAQEMERQQQLMADKQKAQQAKVLASMGFRKDKMVLVEAWKGWRFEWLRAVDAQAHKLNKNKAMLEYSKFILKGKAKTEGKALLASCFTEWHREGRIIREEMDHEDTRRQLAEMRDYAAGLESRMADMQDQISLYDRQIDLITETLQKELKTKEELATELRNAHAQMRKFNYTPTTAATAGEGGDSSRHGDWSRTSSEKTIDHVATPRRRLGKASSSLAPTLPGGVPAMPQLPKGRGELLGHASPGREASQEGRGRRRREDQDWTG